MTANPRPVIPGHLDDPPEGVPFRCDIVFTGDRAIVSVRGELDTLTAPPLLDDIIRALDRPIARMIVDLGRVTFVDSCGLATLVAGQYRAIQQGTTFELASVPKQARRIFEMTNLAELFGLDD